MLDGTDESSYQGPDTPAGAFFGVKVTQGTGYRSPRYSAQLASGRAKGELPIHYHFLNPGDPVAQARWFLKNADIRSGELIACDWEATGATESNRDAFIKAVKAAHPRNKAGLYCSLSWWQNSREKFYGDFLWVADYTYRKGFVVAAATFDQYSDRPMDLDVARFTTKAELINWARGLEPKPTVKKTAPPAAPKLDPALASPMHAINVAAKKVPWHSVAWNRLHNAALALLGRK